MNRGLTGRFSRRPRHISNRLERSGAFAAAATERQDVIRTKVAGERVTSLEDLSTEEVREALAYAGLVLVSFELVKSMIVKSIKFFYADVTFGEGIPFRSYDEDVLSRHRNEFEACLLYLRDFMEPINSEDLMTVQALRKHRNDLAHDLVVRLPGLRLQDYQPLLENDDRTLFKLSNSRTPLSEAHVREVGGEVVVELLGETPSQYPDRLRAASPIEMLPLRVRQFILHGSEDDVVPIDLLRHYARAAEAAGDTVELIELTGTGHMEYLDPDSEAHAMLRRWLLASMNEPELRAGAVEQWLAADGASRCR